MKRASLVRYGLLLLLVVAGYLQKDRFLGEPAAAVSSDSPAAQIARDEASPEVELRQAPAPHLVMRDVTIRDVDGRIAFRGDVDLSPTLRRIAEGRRDPHENDGAVFRNREGRLPRREPDYYREIVIRTPGIRHAGPQRLILGRGGDIYYTPDHYQTFRRVER